VQFQTEERTQYKKVIERYLRVEKTEKGCDITVRVEAVANALQTSGWFVLINNQSETPQQAFDKYRLKDVVEKGFWKYKNNIGLDRLRVHTDNRAMNKCFIAFVALILLSSIRNTPKDSRCFDRVTVDKLFLTLANLKSVTIGKNRVLRPLTRQQKELFEVFGMPPPVG